MGFFAALRVSLLLVHDPGVSEVEQFCHRQQVVRIEAVGFLPGVLALLIAAAGSDAVPGAFVAAIAPDGDLQDAVADLVCWIRHDVSLLLLVSGPTPGPYGNRTEAALAGSSWTTVNCRVRTKRPWLGR